MSCPSELFESSKTTENRELINFVFSNLSLRGRKLEYTLRKSFDMLLNLPHCPEWLPVLDEFRTFMGEIEETLEDYSILLTF